MKALNVVLIILFIAAYIFEGYLLVSIFMDLWREDKEKWQKH